MYETERKLLFKMRRLYSLHSIREPAELKEKLTLYIRARAHNRKLMQGDA